MRVVAIADLHVGSRWALADPAHTSSTDAGAPVRAAIYERWQAATSGPWSKPDVLIVDGDAVEGKNRAQGGIGTWTTDLLEQADHASDLLKMWQAKRMYVLQGSGYHVDANNSGLQVEEYMARKLGAEEYPNQEHIKPEHRNHSGASWYLQLEGVNIHVSHKISVSKVFHYQSTPTARQMLQARLNSGLRRSMADALDNKLHIILRAHAHYYNTVGFGGSDGFVLPCWKALDEWMLAGGPLDISPDLGFVAFEIDNGAYRYEKHLFRLEDVQPPPLTIVGGRRRAAGNRPRRRAAKVARRAGRR